LKNLLSCFLFLLASSAQANSWIYLDRIHEAGASSYGHRAIQDSEGTIYVGGVLAVKGSDQRIWVIRKSKDLGKSWKTILNYKNGGNGLYSLAKDNQGTLYAVGTGGNSARGWYWQVLQSTDEGASWNSVDEFQLTPGGQTLGFSITFDLQGGVYVGGTAKDLATPTQHYHWLIRKSEDHGKTWKTVDDIMGSDTKIGESLPHSMTIDSGIVYATGWITFDGETNGTLITRSSTDQGKTWIDSDHYKYMNKQDAGAYAIFASEKDDLYAAGNQGDGKDFSCMIRKSADRGQSWKVIDSYKPAKAVGCDYWAVASYGDTVFAAGRSFYGSDLATRLGVIRASLDQGRTWQTINEDNGNGRGAKFEGLLPLSANKAIVVGTYSDPENGSDWVTMEVTLDPARP